MGFTIDAHGLEGVTIKQMGRLTNIINIFIILTVIKKDNMKTFKSFD